MRVLTLAVVAIALAVGGCGKKGPPRPPPGTPDTFPMIYPPAASDASPPSDNRPSQTPPEKTEK
jgi:predicted small lipoprotein YifL